MATTPTKTQYNPDLTKYQTGSLISSSEDLKKYGIDYSQEEQDRIAGIFQEAATGAYGQAQNQYSQNIADQQASLQDTLRRSQAEAVATGASRGLQAANELSAMLGLQQEAAQGATTLQGDYAASMAAAQQQAADILNQRANTGAQIAAQDLAAQAQQYAANIDYAANDPLRVLSEIAEIRGSGDSAMSDMLLQSYLAANGVDPSTINSLISDYNTAADQAAGAYKLFDANDKGSGGIVNIQFTNAGGVWHEANWNSLQSGKNESFAFSDGTRDYYLKASGTQINESTNSELNSQLNALAGTKKSTGSLIVSGNKAYVYDGSSWHEIVGQGDGAYKGSRAEEKGWDQFKANYGLS